MKLLCRIWASKTADLADDVKSLAAYAQGIFFNHQQFRCIFSFKVNKI